ncbi:Rhamnogalacturonan acetylesterase rhgT [Acholeplasma oculi]|uniref:GDSL-like Lipase/Acylhydrolase family n=1 Tax=Acholeplasma oculi TaxID=35623 RepID=A0A061AA51_9MOLU|nr:rhamnogalacturonan acetylesterase [Acholeplasma oculi]CDR30780.1 GDSL-like Lipase/Acylhydrolase family [Acholeplasma oculi]SKC34949.1 Lysophospholipase L1 [Acholeplasma oculi]SUT89723.1 Rhamnogalacturonan acetylesterase rhgT [Acholeplasma oculi]
MIRVFIIGDSTSAKKEEHKRPESGWGEHIESLSNQEFQVFNYAKNGESTQSFINKGLFDTVLNQLSQDDYLFIQFGHNDQKIHDKNRYTHPYKTYQENITYFYQEASKKGAKVLLLSSISRRDFKNHKRINKKTLGDYPKSIKILSNRLNIPFIDMFKKTVKLYEYLGFELSKELFLHLKPGIHKNYMDGVSDNTHLNEFGAKIIAQIVLNEIKRKQLLNQTMDPIKSYRMIDIKRLVYVQKRSGRLHI